MTHILYFVFQVRQLKEKREAYDQEQKKLKKKQRAAKSWELCWF